MTKANPHFGDKIAKFIKDLSDYTIKQVTELPAVGEENVLYQCSGYEYVFKGGEWVYYLVPVFIKPVDNEFHRTDPSTLKHGTACLDLENMDVYVVLEGCWACFSMHNFITEEVIG